MFINTKAIMLLFWLHTYLGVWRLFMMIVDKQQSVLSWDYLEVLNSVVIVIVVIIVICKVVDAILG